MMKRKLWVLGLAIAVALLLSIDIATAAPAPNKGSDVSAQKAADMAKQNANENAAFNRAEDFCSNMPYGSENYCGYIWIGSGGVSIYML